MLPAGRAGARDGFDDLGVDRLEIGTEHPQISGWTAGRDLGREKFRVLDTENTQVRLWQHPPL